MMKKVYTWYTIKYTKKIYIVYKKKIGRSSDPADTGKLPGTIVEDIVKCQGCITSTIPIHPCHFCNFHTPFNKFIQGQPLTTK